MRPTRTPCFPRLLLLAPLLAACQKSVSTPFPDGLEPLEDCSAGMPDSGDGDYPQTALVASGETDDWMYAHVCGYVQSDVDAAWQAIQDPDVVTDQDFEPEYEVSYRIHHLVEDILTVEYDIDWRQGVWEEDDDGVQSVAARFQKTEGSSLIELIEGSLVLATVDEQVVSFELVVHHKSLGYQLDELELKATDLYDSVAAVATGQPLPTYDDE